MKTLDNRLKRHHLIQDRKLEIYFGIFLFIAGSLLVYDAFNARGKELPWPFKLLAPW